MNMQYCLESTEIITKEAGNDIHEAEVQDSEILKQSKARKAARWLDLPSINLGSLQRAILARCLPYSGSFQCTVTIEARTAEGGSCPTSFPKCRL
jgi:hypothetical protein